MHSNSIAQSTEKTKKEWEGSGRKKIYGSERREVSKSAWKSVDPSTY